MHHSLIRENQQRLSKAVEERKAAAPAFLKHVIHSAFSYFFGGLELIQKITIKSPELMCEWIAVELVLIMDLLLIIGSRDARFWKDVYLFAVYMQKLIQNHKDERHFQEYTKHLQQFRILLQNLPDNSP